MASRATVSGSELAAAANVTPPWRPLTFTPRPALGPLEGIPRPNYTAWALSALVLFSGAAFCATYFPKLSTGRVIGITAASGLIGCGCVTAMVARRHLAAQRRPGDERLQALNSHLRQQILNAPAYDAALIGDWGDTQLTEPEHQQQLVCDNVYLGALAAVEKVPELQIQHVISLSSHAWSKNAVIPPGVTRTSLLIEDVPEHQDALFHHLELLSAEIDAGRIQGTTTLVHCMQGKSRSSTVVLYYLMSRCRVTYDQAFNYLKNIRLVVEPIPAFEARLKAYGDNGYVLTAPTAAQVAKYQADGLLVKAPAAAPAAQA